MSVEEILNESFGLYKNKFVTIIIATFIASVGSLFIITAPPLFFGIYLMALNIVKGVDVKIGDVFKGFNYFFVSWIMTIIAAFTILFGLALLVIPGILLILLYQYAIPIAVSENLGAYDSLKKSYRIGMDNFQFTLMLGILIFIINAIGSSVGVGWFITYPFTVICLVLATQKLSGENK